MITNKRFRIAIYQSDKLQAEATVMIHYFLLGERKYTISITVHCMNFSDALKSNILTERYYALVPGREYKLRFYNTGEMYEEIQRLESIGFMIDKTNLSKFNSELI